MTVPILESEPDQPQHAGGMIALIPTDPCIQQMVVDDGDDPNQMHLTLVYLGDDVTGWDADRIATLMSAAQSAASDAGDENGLMHARAFGHAVFNPDGFDDRDPCAVYLVGDSDQLGLLRDRLSAFADVSQHEPFVPHITAGQGLDPGSLSYTGAILFDRMRVALGGDVTDMPLGDGNEGDPVTAAAPVVTDPGAPIEPVSESNGEMRVRFPCIAIEGQDTRDGRFIDPGQITSGMLPMSIMAQLKAPHGGDDPPAASLAGRLDTIQRQPGPEVISGRTGQPFPEGTFVWSGEGVIGTDVTVDGHNVADLVRQRFLRGTSADLLPSDFTVIGEEGFAPDPANPSRRLVVHSGEIGGITLVPIAAFGDCYVELADEDTPPDPITPDELPVGLAASAAPSWQSPEVGDMTGENVGGMIGRTKGGNVAAKARDKAKAAGHTMPNGSYPIENGDDLINAIQSIGRAPDPVATRKHIIKHAKRLGLMPMIPNGWNEDGTVEDEPAGSPESVAASGTGTAPPIDWFRDPGLDGPTIPPVVTDDGRIYGHVAAWSSNHIGFTNRKVSPPRSRTDYAHFHVAAARVVNDDGETVMIPAGHLALDTGHAGMDADYLSATAHYDNTGAIVADVCAGEDDHGIWVAGSIVPGLDDIKLHKLRSCGLSGDWRRIGAGLELVAAISVPTPGFPVPRARVASGVPVSLVAAGAMTPEYAAVHHGLSAGRLDPAVISSIAHAVVEGLNERDATRAAFAAHSALLAELDDTPAVVASLLAEVDDTPALVAGLIEELEGEGLTAAGGREVTPKDAENTERLMEYWAHGKGAALIRWGEPNDFYRCRDELAKYVPPGHTLDGLCSNLHMRALGVRPGQEDGKK